VSHDLNVVRHMSDRMIVMYLGVLSELGSAAELFDDPRHPYTEALIAANPNLEGVRAATRLTGAVPDPANPPRGCRFHTRCPVATPVCGWEFDDVLRQLELLPGAFDDLSGVERRDDFDAAFTFETTSAAERFAAVVRSDALPSSMRQAMTGLSVEGSSVELRFRRVDEVPLYDLGRDRASACVLVEGDAVGSARPSASA
jgi:oligopeptide/dipeptide ABC transporter ATP-binding protein